MVAGGAEKVGGAGGSRPGCRANAGDYASGSEETTTAGDLRPQGTAMTEAMEEAGGLEPGLFRTGPWWTGDGTSSVSRRVMAADGGVAGFGGSADACSASDVPASSLQGVVGGTNSDG